MPVDVLLGLQWGDEGKGKIVDLISDRYSVIARFQGGPNAGHTIIIGDKKFVLHQVPSGIIRKDIINVVGNGVVIDPFVLRQEIIKLEDAGIEVKPRLMLSKKANLILPTHKLIDSIHENNPDEKKIGSTQKGIGPTYRDKAGRFGLRLGDIFRKDFDSLYNKLKERHLALCRMAGCKDEVNDSDWLGSLDYLRKLNFADTELLINEKIKSGEHILAEGAQGTLLDVDFGSYPYVTSSNTITAAACTGLGFAPKHIGKVYGIFKAYATRVGEGPFPTELHDEKGEFLRQKGHEFGSTTGRPRRCGWLDLPALKYAIMLNGVDELIMMKIDVLNELAEIKVCDKYAQGATYSDVTYDYTPEPEYKTFSGWNSGLNAFTEYGHFPHELKEYVSFIEAQVGTSISMISTGPERNESVWK